MYSPSPRSVQLRLEGSKCKLLGAGLGVLGQPHLSKGPYARIRRRRYLVSSGPGATCIGKRRPCHSVIFYLCVKSTPSGHHPANFNLDPSQNPSAGHRLYSPPASNGRLQRCHGQLERLWVEVQSIPAFSLQGFLRNGPKAPLFLFSGSSLASLKPWTAGPLEPAPHGSAPLPPTTGDTDPTQGVLQGA